MKNIIPFLFAITALFCCSNSDINAPNTVTFNIFVNDCDTGEPVCRVRVDIDGRFKGETCRVDPLLSPCGRTCFFIEMTLGPHRIELQKEGYVTLVDTVDIESGKSGKVFCMERKSS